MEYMMKKAVFRSQKRQDQQVDVLFSEWYGHLYYLDIHYSNEPFEGPESPRNIRALFVLNMKEDKLGNWCDGHFGMCRDRYWKKIICNYFRNYHLVMTPEQRLSHLVNHSVFGPKMVEMYKIREEKEVEAAF